MVLLLVSVLMMNIIGIRIMLLPEIIAQDNGTIIIIADENTTAIGDNFTETIDNSLVDDGGNNNSNVMQNATILA
ncbi:MAG: hypothetical protein ACPKPY_00660 [Nitrososphaeraceae archaeon]